MELIEAALIATWRAMRPPIPLKEIRTARRHLQRQFGVDYPFAEIDLKTQGKSIFYEMASSSEGKAVRHLIEASLNGQHVWKEAIQERLEQFDYDRRLELAIRWFPRGKKVPIVVDPRIGFGRPVLLDSRVPTWAIKVRYMAHEGLESIERDFEIERPAVLHALRFEGMRDLREAAYDTVL